MRLSDRYERGVEISPTHYECSSDGYSMIAKNIPQFQAINLLPIRLNPSRLDDRGIIEDTLRKNSASIIKIVTKCLATAKSSVPLKEQLKF